MLTIQSAQNDTYKKFLSLTGSKGLKKEGLFLLSGENLVREFLKRPHLNINAELLTPKIKPMSGALKIELTAELFNEIDVVGTGSSILVLEQPPMAELDKAALLQHQPDGIELVAPLGDPGNLGALIRSAEAFGLRRVLLTAEAAHPFLPKCVKASAGSVLRMALARGPALEEFPPSCLALDAGGTSLHDFHWPKQGMLVVGEEGKGLGSARFDHKLSIPTRGVESLNAVVAASVALALHAAAEIKKQ